MRISYISERVYTTPRLFHSAGASISLIRYYKPQSLIRYHPVKEEPAKESSVLGHSDRKPLEIRYFSTTGKRKEPARESSVLGHSDRKPLEIHYFPTTGKRKKGQGLLLPWQ